MDYFEYEIAFVTFDDIKQANKNDVFEKMVVQKKYLHIQGIIIWHSRSRRCILITVRSLHYNELD